jgi:hypothetical protein
MSLLRVSPNGVFADEDEENEKASHHVQTTHNSKGKLKTIILDRFHDNSKSRLIP